MIFVGETAAGPADHGDVQFFQRRNDVVAEAVRIRNGRILPDPDSSVDTAPQVFGKLTVKIAAELVAGSLGMHRH